MNTSSSSRRSRSSVGSTSTFSATPLAQPQQLPNDLRRERNEKVLGGRSVDLPEAESTLLNGQLQTFGWHMLHTKLAAYVHEPYVKEFYANLNFIDDNDDPERPVGTTNIFGRIITINRAFLANALDIPDVGECIYFKKRESDFQKNFRNFDERSYYNTFAKPNFQRYTKDRMEESDLLEKFRTLNAFLDANILPTTGTNNSVSKYQGFIIFCIATKRQLSLPYIILREMQDICHNKRKSLGYGGFLTTIFRQLGMQINRNNCVALKRPINGTTLNLRESHPFYVEEEVQDQGQGQGQEQEQVQEYEQQQQQHHQSQGQEYYEEMIRNHPSIDEIGVDMLYDLNNRF